MNERARILVVAATSRELAPPDGWLALKCGVGPVEAAATTAAAIAELRPAAILHVGIAGAHRESALPPASLVIGTEARYCDIDAARAWAPYVVPASPALLEAAARALPEAPQMLIGTSARVGGTSGCMVEAMEGFGVLRAAQIAGVPAIEIRAISNEIEEPDRARWHFDASLAAITTVTPVLVAAFARVLAELRSQTGSASA
jgi:nucleoside phosphorylase